MPASVERCVKKVKKTGKGTNSSWAVCMAAHSKKVKKNGK